MKSPEIESFNSLQSFLNGSNFQVNQLYATKDTTALYDLYNWGVGLPDVVFYNDKHEYLEYRATEESCNASIRSFIDTLSTGFTGIYTPTTNYIKMEELFSKLTQLPNLNSLELSDEYDFTLVLIWSKYTGKVSIDHLVDWQKSIEQARNRGLNINTIYLSLDYMDHFNMSEDQLPDFKFN